MQSSHKAVQYPRYTKLIINHVFATYPSISRRLNELYHNLKDDDLLQMMFTTRKPEDAIAMRILDELLTEGIKKNKAYKAYDDDYNCIAVLTTQPSLVVSTQGPNRTHSAPSSPKPKRTPKKKEEKVRGESSEPKKTLKFKITTKKPDPVAPIPTTVEVEKDLMTEIEQEIDKMNEGEEEEDLGFVDRLLLSQEDPGTRKQTGSLEIREEKKQTPIATPHRSPRIDLSLDKEPTTELMDTDVHMSDVPSHSSSQRAKHLRGNIDDSLDKDVPSLVLECINQFLKDNHRRVINEELYKETKSIKDEFSSMVSKELVATAPQQIQEFHWNSCNNSASLSSRLQVFLFMYFKNNSTLQWKIVNEHKLLILICGLFSRKSLRSIRYFLKLVDTLQLHYTHYDYDGWYEVQEIDDDKVISEEASLEFLAELLNIGDKRTPTIVDLHKMKVTLDDMMEIIIHATSFPEDDLEEHLTRWVGKVFKRFNEEARLSIQH
ncbi:hypothetical protein Tco_0899927 [Tanacetum coccineum]